MSSYEELHRAQLPVELCGGPLDGERRVLPPGYGFTYRVAEYPMSGALAPQTDGPPAPAYRVLQYRLALDEHGQPSMTADGALRFQYQGYE
ncbi:hypothetical protein [Streptomyces sp. NPDC093261]|uniref:hypothetical protein n=1 Tax=Streptomyces sp. NPDC093261 TaxID=3366037 RepID=UPI003823A698